MTKYLAKYLTPPQLAHKWGCKPSRVVGLCKSRRLRAFSLSDPGCKRPHWRIPVDAVAEFEASNQAQPAITKPARRRRQLAGAIQFYK